MRLREGKTRRLTLVVLAVLAVIAFALVDESRYERKHAHYREMITAVGLMKRGIEKLREERIRLKLPPLAEEEDPFGLLGTEDNKVTTDRGDPDSKLIVCNPLTAAVMVDMLMQANVQRDDVVAIGCTGSFPGANLAAYAACEAIGARPIVLTSLGASTWGANFPEFTWLDMERHLAASTSLRFRSVAASLGGGGDRGLGLSEAGRELLKKAAERNQVPLLIEKTLDEQIKKHMQVYLKEANGKPIKAYVNIGGGVASLGARVNALKHLKNGLNLELPLLNYPVRGVAIEFGTMRPPVPVIHILEVQRLAKSHHLPALVRGKKPEELTAGENVLFETRYDLGVTILATAILAALTFLLIRIDLKHLGQGRPLSPAELAALEGEPAPKLPKAEPQA